MFVQRFRFRTHILMSTPDRDALLGELQRLHNESERLPSGQTVDKHGVYSLRDYREAFGSFPDALAAAGFDLPDLTSVSERNSQRISDAEALSDLHRLLATLDRRPTSRDINKHGRYSEKFYRDRFGSINKALEAAGFRTDCPGLPTSLLVEDLRQLGEQLGRKPTREEFREYSQASRHSLEKRIGWPEALRRAGLHNPDSPGPTRYSDREILEEIARVWTKIGCAPTAADMSDHGNVSVGTVAYHFGRWTAAKECVKEQFDVP